jgi:tRNA threonylcarbamoyl adenosine modification protein (Sua5/YciO/YrdC/YwlC family)
MAKLIYTYTQPTSEKDLRAAIRILENDGIIAYPTDVNWAFGCSPFSKKALERIIALKPLHPKQQPFTLLCNSVSMIAQFAEVSNNDFRVLKRLFPGPFTVLLNRGQTFPKQLKDKRTHVGVRIPDSHLLLDLITMMGQPLATSSVPSRPNGGEALSYGYEVDQVYGHALDLILDLGSPSPYLETTVLDLSRGGVDIVREGAGVIGDKLS